MSTDHLSFEDPSVLLFCFVDHELSVPFKPGLTTSVGWLVTPTDHPKSARNRCVIEVFGAVCVLSFGYRIFCWYRGFCHRNESDLLLFSKKKCPPLLADQFLSWASAMCSLIAIYTVKLSRVYNFRLRYDKIFRYKCMYIRLKLLWSNINIPQYLIKQAFSLCIAPLCHIGHGFLKFSLIYLNSDKKVCGNVM